MVTCFQFLESNYLPALVLKMLSSVSVSKTQNVFLVPFLSSKCKCETHKTNRDLVYAHFLTFVTAYTSTRAWYQLHVFPRLVSNFKNVFPRLALIACFPQHVRHCLHVFEFRRLAPGVCFPALYIRCKFSHASHWLHVFPRMSPLTRLPAVGTGCMFFRAWYQLNVSHRVSPLTCFPAHGTGCMFSRVSRWLHVFPRLAPVTCFTI